MAAAQPDSVSLGATITLVDGRAVQVSDCVLFTPHRQPPTFGPKDEMDSPQDLVMKCDGSWKVFKASDIERMEIDRSDMHDWHRATVTLAGGARFSGQLPIELFLTWITGERFHLRGRTKLLGSEGTWESDIVLLTSIVRSADGGTHTITDHQGTVTVVSDLRSFAHGGTSVGLGRPGEMYYVEPITWGRTRRIGPTDRVAVKVGDATVELTLQDISTLEFPGARGHEDVGKVKVSTRSGETESGILELADRVWGRLGNGDVFFEEFRYRSSTIRKIEFTRPRS